MLLGSLWRLSERYAWLSMRELSVNAANPVVEERFWDVFPSQSLRFWPLFMRKSPDIAAFLEKTNPVLVKTSITGFGSFAAEIKLLSPRMVVEWKEEVWCVSKEGRMWNMSEGSFGFHELKIPLKPLWRVTDSQVAVESGLPVPGGVFPSVFLTGAIDDFLEGLGGASWFGGVEEVSLDRRAGGDFFKLRYVLAGQSSEIWIQKGKYEWEELSLALEHILGRLEKEGGRYLVDATYEDKIVVKDLPAGAGGGSSK